MRQGHSPAVVVLTGTNSVIDRLFEKLEREVQDLFRSLTCEFLKLPRDEQFAEAALRCADIVVMQDTAPSERPARLMPHDLYSPLYLLFGSVGTGLVRAKRCEIINPRLSLEQKLDSLIVHIRSERIRLQPALAA